MMPVVLAMAAVAWPQDPAALLVGNSYTAQNGLALRFQERAQADVPAWATLTAHSITTGGKDLTGHLRDADGTAGDTALRQALVTGPDAYAVVTLQDQSQIPGFPQDGATWLAGRDAAVELTGLVTAHGADTWFLLTWGRRDGDSSNPSLYPDFPTMQDRLTEGYLAYRDAARDAHPDAVVHVAPVGEVFRSIWQTEWDSGTDPTLESSLFHRLYAADGSHPSAVGTFVASGTFVAAMTGRRPSPQDFLVDLGLDLDTQEALTDRVAEVVLSDPLDTPFDPPWVHHWSDWDGPIHGERERPFVWLDAEADGSDVVVDDGRLWIEPDATLSASTVTVRPLGTLTQLGALTATDIAVEGQWIWEAGRLSAQTWTGDLTGGPQGNLVLPSDAPLAVSGSVALQGSTLTFSGALNPGETRVVLQAASLSLDAVIWDLPPDVEALVDDEGIQLVRQPAEPGSDGPSDACGCRTTGAFPVVGWELVGLWALCRRRRP